jgi:dTDP-4-amino-4,6-dideoxygalactose transaminase/ADP-ribose pyrophosphatase YjhB (NUDIX family)
MVLKHFCTTTYIFNDEGDKCLLIRHKKLPFFLPPGGHIDENEDYLESSQREVAEELGFAKEALSYPAYLQEKDGVCLQPWAIQKYTIIPDEHFHYDLVFGAIVKEDTPIKPGDGESQNIQWFEVKDIDSIETTDECKGNIKRMSQKIRDAREVERVQQDLYIWPRYDESLKKDLSQFVEGRDFGTWNLGDLYEGVPCGFAEKMGVNYGIFTSTGTAALHAILIALGLKPGDEVIVPSMTFVRAATPLNHLSLQPVIADIDPTTGNIDPDSIEANITPKTKAVVVVHMWGVPADCERISEICKKNDIRMIEDFSHAHFSMYKDKFVGSFGDAAFASLQRKKNISVGEGGIVVTKDEGTYKRLQQITSPGSFMDQSNYSEVDFSGYGLNMRINPFGALTAKNLLPKVDNILEDKRVAVEKLTAILAKHSDKFELVEIPDYADKSTLSWYSYKLKLKNTTLAVLKTKKLWKFSDFGYPPIAEHRYWEKDATYFPFSLGIKPAVRVELPGQAAYLKDRVTLNIPTVPASYWTDEVVAEWEAALVG